ncbi:MAG: isoleucine--tRNA ligase [Desulfurococcales archaeon]|nr:isoleucine--tRNA ligase [Desulfurococcales archaeon]
MPSVPGDLNREKYNQFALEEWVKSFWENERVYRLVKEKSNRSSKKFYFLDGPPYASATSIHIGTAWNKIIKDVVLRYKRMTGHRVWDQPGFDTHGLPIEVKIERKLGITSKKEIVEKIGVDKFIGECRRFVDESIEAMTKQFREIGVFMDWDNPYVTYRDDYIESGWWLIKKAWEKGLLYRGLQVHHWCPRCETTLADYEVSEYRVLEDPSIYVKFPLKGRSGESLLVWTTTPWTLPANAFVMASPTIKYSRVRVGGEVLIMASSRVEAVMKEAGVSEYEILEEIPGAELDGLEYVHPLEKLVDAQRELAPYHRIVMAPEAVSAHEGTGLVHSAPGHGDIDFKVNQEKVGAPLISLVDDTGKMSEGAGKYTGLYFRTEANKAIVEDLERMGALFHKGKVRHRYPVCWRCKTPLVLRATKQWFIRVSALKTPLLKEAKEIRWQPDWAKTRFVNLLKEVRDWVISRQRFWGIPLPVWICQSCNYTHVVGSVDELVEMGGKRPENLHRPWVDQVELKCPKCGGVMKRVPDVLDVWFDSGISFYASLGFPRSRLWDEMKPVDFIVEGHDQIRGWFFSLLRSGVIGFNSSPYKSVMVHGFALDEHGREMHKSLGNYVDFEELISKVPRDVVRLWVMQTTVWEDLKFSWKGLEEMGRTFNIIWNTFAFASTYMSLDKYDPTTTRLESVEDSLQPEDRWLLSRLNRLIKEYREAMEDMRPHDAARMIKNFIVEDVSHWYIRLIRRRVWEEEDTPSKRAAYTTLYITLRNWLVLAAPFIPFTSEYLYQKLIRPSETESPVSVHLLDMSVPDESRINDDLESDMNIVKRIVEAAASARSSAGIKLRRPVRRIIVAPVKPGVGDAVKRLEHIVREMANTKKVEVVGSEFFEQAKIYDVEPNYKELGPAFKEITPKVVSLIRDHSKEVAETIAKQGRYTASIEGRDVVIERAHVKLNASYPEWLSVKETDIALVGVDTRIEKEEMIEGIAREIVRRIQAMRKELDLPVNAYIEAWITGDGIVVESAKAMENYIANETRSKTIHYTEPPNEAYTREWEVDEGRVKIGIRADSG